MDIKKLKRKMWMIPFVMIGMGALVGLTIMSLWNWIMPAVFGLGMISFWQAIGMLILGRLLFGGFKRHRHWGWKHKYMAYRYGHAYAYCGPNKHNPSRNNQEEAIISE